MARIAIMALEGIEEEEVVEVEDTSVDTTEVDEVSTEIEDKSETIDEATEISDTMGEMADVLETPAVGTDEPAPETSGTEEGAPPDVAVDETPVEAKEVSPETAEVVKIATEHFLKRLGYKKRSMTYALESYGTSKSANKETIKQIRIAQEEIQKRITIAQEGILDSIKNKIDMILTNNDKLVTRLNAVSSAYDSNGLGTEPIKAPAFGKYLNISSKASVTGSDVLSIYKNVTKNVNNKELINALTSATAGMENITKAIKGSTFIALKADVDKTVEAARVVTGIASDMEGTFHTKSKGIYDGDFEPISKSDKQKLSATILSLLESKELKTSVKLLKDAISSNTWTTFIQTKFTRVMSTSTADIDSSKNAINSINNLAREVSNILKNQHDVCHAGIEYIKASTNKKAPVAA